jgi:hypothetical protein
MLDELDAPYSFASFAEFCMTQDFAEGVDFSRSCLLYCKNALSFYIETTDNNPEKPLDMNEKAFESQLADLENQYQNIFSSFLLASSKKKIKLPEVVITELMKQFEKGNRHPNQFTRAIDFYISNLKNNVWESYQNYVDPKHVGKMEEGISRN